MTSDVPGVHSELTRELSDGDYNLKNASKSAFIISACVVGMP